MQFYSKMRKRQRITEKWCEESNISLKKIIIYIYIIDFINVYSLNKSLINYFNIFIHLYFRKITGPL